MNVSRVALLPLAASIALAGAAQAAPLTHTVATFTQKKDRNGNAPKALTYANLDVTKVATTTIKTPVYTAVVTPVYTTVRQPVYNAHGVITGYRNVQVQTGTTTTQKLTGYTTTVTKAATIRPSSKIYTKVGTSTIAKPIAAVATINLPTKSAFTGTVTGKQNAMLTISTASSAPAVFSGFTFSQSFGAGTILLARTVGLRAIGATGRPTGPKFKNLLTVHFTNALLTGDTRTDLWTLSGDNALGGLAFTSDFFKTAGLASMQSYGFTMGGLASLLALAPTDPSFTTVTGGHSLSSFVSNVSGAVLTSAVPEPATWALMMLGMGAVGSAMRRRRRTAGALQAA